MSLHRRTFFGMMFVCILAAPSLCAQDTIESVSKRLEASFPKLLELRRSGTVGETYAGYVEAVKPADAGAVAAIIDAVNADRKILYQLVAEKQNTTAQKVGELNASRNYEKGKSGDYFKMRNGEWKRKS